MCPHQSCRLGARACRSTLAIHSRWYTRVKLLKSRLRFSGKIRKRLHTSIMALSRSTILVVTTLLSSATAINNGLATTPPMGWVRYRSIDINLTLTRKEQLERFWMRRLRRSTPHNLRTDRKPWPARLGLQLCRSGRLLAESKGSRQEGKASAGAG